MTPRDPSASAPRIVVTLAVPDDQSEPDIAVRRNGLYVAALVRHGAVPVPLDARTPLAARDDALRSMDGLLLSGGADVDPSRYGQPIDGSREIEPERDELEARAWRAAESRQVPVLGICRGLQAINVFSGGSILQHVDGHAGAGWGTGPPVTHPLRVVAGTRLAKHLRSVDTLEVNAYHHQGILERDLAPGLRAAAWADSSAGPLVEGLEGRDERFVIGVQCHPERTESTPAAFEQLFAAFVKAAASGPRSSG
ncbi:MAG: putative glutamine amidotransferase [Chloroflexota bacterium]|nr:putative glutamine amidotransferase [Chloroflexota bacterium]